MGVVSLSRLVVRQGDEKSMDCGDAVMLRWWVWKWEKEKRELLSLKMKRDVMWLFRIRIDRALGEEGAERQRGGSDKDALSK